jgi:hypothetical protein
MCRVLTMALAGVVGGSQFDCCLIRADLATCESGSVRGSGAWVCADVRGLTAP